MATIWITYAWADNIHEDVDFIASELRTAGLQVKLDRWNLSAGGRLWEQIARFIDSPTESDAWLFYATTNSLESEGCKEELAYALDRALKVRGTSFPVIALFPASVEASLIPPAIRTRLYVNLTDPDWKERIVAAAERRAPSIADKTILPYYFAIHRPTVDAPYAIEVRPRAGAWMPFFAAVPAEEITDIFPMQRGAPGHIPGSGVVMMSQGLSTDGKWWFQESDDQATPTQSYYIFLPTLPSAMVFGGKFGPQHTWKRN